MPVIYFYFTIGIINLYYEAVIKKRPTNNTLVRPRSTYVDNRRQPANKICVYFIIETLNGIVQLKYLKFSDVVLIFV